MTEASTAVVSKIIADEADQKGFRISDGKGFQITFLNGWTISVQFGPGNYCENQSRLASIENYDEARRQAGQSGCATAECAAWDATGKWLHVSDTDDVIGWQTPEQVLALMTRVAAMPDTGAQS